MKNKKMMVAILLVVGLVSLILIGKSYSAFAEVDKPVENNKVLRNEFAMYVQGVNGYEEYTEKSFPNKDMYSYNDTRSYCVDINNQEIEDLVTVNDDNTITIQSDKTVYCTFYFDLKTQ